MKPVKDMYMLLILFLLGGILKAKGYDLQEEEEDKAESRFLSMDGEEPGILLPPDDKYNFVGEDDPTKSNGFISSSTTETLWRTGRSSPLPSTTIVTTSGFSIRPPASGSGSNSKSKGKEDSYLYINAKPVSITTSGNSYTVKDDKFPFETKKNDKQSTIYVKNSCFGPRCLTSSSSSYGAQTQGSAPYQQQLQGYDDNDYKSYHYVLNKDVKQRYRGMGLKNPYIPTYTDNKLQRRMDSSTSSSSNQHVSLSMPFRVGPAVGNYETTHPPNSKLRSNRRYSRTTRPTTTTPGWVKLQPIPLGQYDPFTLKKNNNSSFNPNGHQFSDRLGVELDPDSFAERWGWGDRDHDNGGGGGTGSRLPNWLQEMNKNSNNGPIRDQSSDDGRNWVKLEPIPVAGVTISKWVPKGTPSSDLPSTNWPSRDRPHSQQPPPNSILNPGAGQVNPGSTKWWDIVDNINRLHQNQPRPSYSSGGGGGGPSHHHHSYPGSSGSPPPGWASNNNIKQSSSWDLNKSPTNSWNDIIYPDGPASATASWQQDKGSPFSSTGGGGDTNTRRPGGPATGSWSADRGSNSNQYSSNPYYSNGNGNRRTGSSSSYPNRQYPQDDPRWVLISNSRKVTVSDPNRGIGHRYHRPPFDFPFYEQPPQQYNNNRIGKNYKDGLKSQDDAFYRVNATLASLTPVLSHRGGDRYRKINNDNFKDEKKKIPAFTKPYVGDGRAHSNSNDNDDDGVGLENEYLGNTSEVPLSTTTTYYKNKRLSINPVYAAVGAGMIPATMAAVLPMVLGRKRRSTASKEEGAGRGHERIENVIYPPRITTSLEQSSPPWMVISPRRR